MNNRTYYVYIASNISRTLYVGVTNDLYRRMYEQKMKLNEGFTRRYNITMLVWFDETNDVLSAIEAEKRIKGWTRQKKIELIESMNPEWRDLSAEWYVDEGDPSRARSG